jgi:hypothetical protein
VAFCAAESGATVLPAVGGGAVLADSGIFWSRAGLGLSFVAVLSLVNQQVVE